MTRQRLVCLTSGLLLALLINAATVAQAGTIFLPGTLANGQFVLEQGSDIAQLKYNVRYSTITANVDGNEAAVHVQETVRGPERAVNTVCLIPLPTGAKSTGAAVFAGIPNGEHTQLTATQFLDAAQAQRLYESIAQQLDSVAVLSLSGRPALLVPDYRLQGQVEIVVDYRQSVAQRDGVNWLTCPTPATAWCDRPVASLSIAATIHSPEGQPLRTVFSPTHDAAVERDGLNEAHVRIKSDNHSDQNDFRLCWVADADELGLRMLTHREEGDEDGYFMLIGNPTGGTTEAKVLDKDMVFVLDTSGSMRGEKIEQARAAIEYCIGHLNPGDRFNIITFGTEVANFREAPVARTDETLAAAYEYIEQVVAQGRTNIGGALAAALQQKSDSNRLRITIFLTDGTPTAGELMPDKIVEAAEAIRPCPTRIFVLGVGHDVNAHLLDRLAEATDGSSQYVVPEEDIDSKVATLYDRLSHPVLTQVMVDFGDLTTHSVYPKKLPTLFKGSEVMIFGRYREGGSHTFSVSGTLAGKSVTHRYATDLAKKPTGDRHEFVAPLWAARKIGYLLQELRLHGENEELLAEVVRLSKLYGIVTEYTEFLAMSDAEVTAEAAVDEARRLVNMANSQAAGQWAFNQARNDQQLQNRKVASGRTNYYFDRLGRTVINDAIRQFGSQTFYLRDGQWVDAEDQGERSRRVIQLHSEEYRDLVRTNARFARAQQLGWATEMNLGDERIVVEKDGQQKSEQLRELRQRQMSDRSVQQRIMLQQGNQFQQQNFQQQLNINQFRNQAPNQQFNQRLNQRGLQQIDGQQLEQQQLRNNQRNQLDRGNAPQPNA